jgi:hypothetical protein
MGGTLEPMSLRRTLSVLASGTVVYFVMAACSSVSGGVRGATGSDSGFVDALVDVLVSPIPDANAGPTVDTVACSTGGTVDGGASGTYLYVEKTYPGKTVADLSAVRVVVNYPGSFGFQHPPGYASVIASPFVKDGAVAVFCGPAGTNLLADSVTFISP